MAFLIVLESLETVQIRPFLDIDTTVHGMTIPTGSLVEEEEVNLRKPATSGTPRSRMYPWSSTVLTVAERVWTRTDWQAKQLPHTSSHQA